jgi:hypothetical protein
MRRTLGILGGLALGFALSQFPEYAQQYVQRLGGAVDELRIIVEDFDRGAAEAGLTRDQALARFAGVNDSFIAGRGEAAAATIARYETLSATLSEIRGASGWERFVHLPDYLDSEVGRRALADYQPALPVTLEGFAYAGVGFAIGYVALSALVAVLLLPFRRRRPKRQRPLQDASQLVSVREGRVPQVMEGAHHRGAERRDLVGRIDEVGDHDRLQPGGRSGADAGV